MTDPRQVKKITKINYQWKLISVVLFLVLGAGLFYYYALRPEREPEENKAELTEKNDKETAKKELELKKAGYVKSITGTVVGVDKNQGAIVVLSSSPAGSTKKTVFFNKKTEFKKIITKQKKSSMGVSPRDLAPEDMNQQEIATSDSATLEYGANVQVVFVDLGKLEDGGKLEAAQIHTYEHQIID